MADDITLRDILDRLDRLEAGLGLRLEPIEQKVDGIDEYVRRAENAADSAANSAQRCVGAFESLGARFEILRKEHGERHPDATSKVPAAMLIKKSSPSG